MTMPMIVAKHLYWRSLLWDNYDPPKGGYNERLRRRVGNEEYEKFKTQSTLATNCQIAVAVMLEPVFWGVGLFFFLLARAVLRS